jgi:hypothetical protein
MKRLLSVCVLFSLIGVYTQNCIAGNPSKTSPLTCALKYNISGKPPSTIDRELVPDFEKLIKKPFASFGKKLQNKYAVRVMPVVSEKSKLEYCNCLLLLDDVQAEYSHQQDYIAAVSIDCVLMNPENKDLFRKKYSSQVQLQLASEWPEWVGINKAVRAALESVLNKILNDPEFGSALTSVDKTVFLKSDQQPGSIPPGSQPNMVEDRLKKLKSLKDQGLITEEEYQQKQKAILDQL